MIQQQTVFRHLDFSRLEFSYLAILNTQDANKSGKERKSETFTSEQKINLPKYVSTSTHLMQWLKIYS